MSEGNCYSCAFDALMTGNPDWKNPRLIHSDITHSITGEPYSHAYIAYDKELEFPEPMPEEWGGNIPTMQFVHDQSNSFKGSGDIPRMFYEMNARPIRDTMREYTLEQMMEQAMKHSHYGPWPDEEAFEKAWKVM